MNGGVLIMKKYLKEILILLIQLFMFYVFPLFAGPTDVMGMIVLLFLLFKNQFMNDHADYQTKG